MNARGLRSTVFYSYQLTFYSFDIFPRSSGIFYLVGNLCIKWILSWLIVCFCFLILWWWRENVHLIHSTTSQCVTDRKISLETWKHELSMEFIRNLLWSYCCWHFWKLLNSQEGNFFCIYRSEFNLICYFYTRDLSRGFMKSGVVLLMMFRYEESIIGNLNLTLETIVGSEGNEGSLL